MLEDFVNRFVHARGRQNWRMARQIFAPVLSPPLKEFHAWHSAALPH